MFQSFDFIKHLDTNNETTHYIITAAIAFAIVLVSQVLAWVARKILRSMLKRANSRQKKWYDILLETAIRPVGIIIKVAGIMFALKTLTVDIKNELFQSIITHSEIIFIPLCSWFLTNFITALERSYIDEIDQNKRKGDQTTVQAISKLVRLSVIIVTILIVLQNMGINLTGLLAAGSVGGLVIGFAGKDLLANFFGGLMLYLERPFKVGDWIRSPDREIEGTVVNIGLRTTAIKTFDQRPLYVPNSIFTSISLENPSRMSNRRIYETIGVRYQDISKVEGILKDIRDYILSAPEIEPTLTTMINFNSFAPSSLDFFIYCFTKTTNWQEYHRVKEKVLLAVCDIINSHGAQIAFPTSTIHLQKGDNPEYGSELPDLKTKY